jgi:hypothetical protein
MTTPGSSKRKRQSKPAAAAIPAADVQTAQAALDADRQARAQAATAAVLAVLKRFRCEIVAVPQITVDGRIVTETQVVAR